MHGFPLKADFRRKERKKRRSFLMAMRKIKEVPGHLYVIFGRLVLLDCPQQGMSSHKGKARRGEDYGARL
jgi:hypothetical protein